MPILLMPMRYTSIEYAAEELSSHRTGIFLFKFRENDIDKMVLSGSAYIPNIASILAKNTDSGQGIDPLSFLRFDLDYLGT